MTKLFALTMAAAFLAAACAPQAELVKTRTELSDVRAGNKAVEAGLLDIQLKLNGIEKRLSTLEAGSQETGEIRKSLADTGALIDQLLTDIQLIQGKLEENNFRLQDLGQKLDDRSFKISELAARLTDLEAKVSAQGDLSSSPTPTGPAGQQPRAIEPSEAYRQAKNDYDTGNFELALAGFQNFLVQFPDSTQADNAQYWIGECRYALKDFEQAIDAFSLLLKEHPKSDKVPGAKLKIGLAYLNRENNSKAREWLNKVVKDHPGSREADLARDKLTQIKKK